ncbi:hypothetical protein K505DRAFT_250907 [Melanomma pulvis-pyrius CBS 109.77]|uniref:Copper transport protein n=1 Tax=Melanomma pulvis-pyrius CBS 109.77 TaxID=1314802 RepID=A0A6A6X362_9PLEO|nr:hypothetical protein K505DRAFT_250907 [Melanomma pulvis-pyrius CBS 109.77]
MGAMSGMASTFSIDTSVTLFFTEWKTSTPAAYVFTIFFLFALGIFNRFLGALKSQLEQRWKERQQYALVEPVASHARHAHERQKGLSSTQGHKRKWSRTLRPAPPSLDEEQETEPLSPAPPPESGSHDEEKVTSVGRQGFWRPSAPWSVKRDGIRALLEFIRALVGYILMLAVMTYNVGFLFAVTGSVLLGEFIFGRYMQSGNKGWQEGGCHE